MEYFKFCLKGRRILLIWTIASEIEIKAKWLIVLTVYVYVFYSWIKNSEESIRSQAIQRTVKI